MDRIKINNPFTELLKSYGLTRADFARIIGKESRQAGARWVHNYGKVTIDQLKQLSRNEKVNKSPAEILQDLKAIEQKTLKS